MSAHRTDMHKLQDLVRFHRQGHCARQVARLLNMGPNTERKYRQALIKEGLLHGDPNQLPSMELLKEAVGRQLPAPAPVQRHSTAEPYRDLIKELMDKGAGPRAIFDRLRLDHADDFNVSYDAIKRFVRKLKQAQLPKANQVTIVVNTDPGLVAQVDFGAVGKLRDAAGKLRQAYVFVMVLGRVSKFSSRATAG